MIATLPLVPRREAPAFSISIASSSVLMPPDALTESPSGASSRSSETSSGTAPPGPKPV